MIIIIRSLILIWCPFIDTLIFFLSLCSSQSVSRQLLWNYWTKFYKTWYVARTLFVVVHITRELWSPNICGSYAHLNLEICVSFELRNLSKILIITLTFQILWNYWTCYCNFSAASQQNFMKLFCGHGGYCKGFLFAGQGGDVCFWKQKQTSIKTHLRKIVWKILFFVIFHQNSLSTLWVVGLVSCCMCKPSVWVISPCMYWEWIFSFMSILFCRYSLIS